MTPTNDAPVTANSNERRSELAFEAASRDPRWPKRRQQDDAPVTVEQCDRDAASALCSSVTMLNSQVIAKMIRDGRCDYNQFVLAFARHRLAALASAPAGDGVDPGQVLDDVVPLSIASTWDQSERRNIIRAMQVYAVALTRRRSTALPAGDDDAAASAYVAEYVMSTEGADYEPTDWERELIEDALHGFLSERSLARPRAAVGEREHFLAATTARSWMHHAATCQAIVHRPTGDGYKADCTCGLAGVLHEFDKHVLGAVTIPLQSPPAKVEGSTSEKPS